MPHYMLSVHSPTAPPDAAPPDAASQPPDDEAMAAMMSALESLEQRMHDEGVWTASARLHDPSSATVVRRADGDTLLTDGPYLESKEHVAGFYVIEADDLDAALSWAGEVVDALGMDALEVRPLGGWAA